MYIIRTHIYIYIYMCIDFIHVYMPYCLLVRPWWRLYSTPWIFNSPPASPDMFQLTSLSRLEIVKQSITIDKTHISAKTLVHTKLSFVYCISHLWQYGGFCFCVSLELFGMVSEGFLDPWANLLLSLVPFVSMRVRAARVPVTGLLTQAETIR